MKETNISLDTETNWISVKDKEPPIGFGLLVYTQEQDVIFGYNDGNIFRNENGIPINITHWIRIAPLPGKIMAKDE